MKSRLVIAVTVALFANLLLLPAAAQPQPQKNSPGAQKPVAEQATDITVTEILLPVTVVDDQERSIFELTKDDFLIYEDGKLQQIEGFEAKSGRPLDIAILMDTSNSVRPKLKYEREAASNFIQTVLRTRRDRVLFATFNDQVELRQDFTDNSELLHTKIADKGIKASGETRLYDAIYRLCEEKLDNTRSPDRRGIIIAITDGEDTASARSLQETLVLAQTKGVPVYGISTKAGGFFGVGAGQVLNADDKDLRRLSQETGGEIFFPGDVLALEKTFRLINEKVRNQYLITYSPDNAIFRGEYRKIQVKLNRERNPNFKDFTVKTRTGYRAIPPKLNGTMLN